MTLTASERDLLGKRETALTAKERMLIQLALDDLEFRAKNEGMILKNDDTLAKLEAAWVRYFLDCREPVVAKTPKKVIPYTELEVGHIVHFYGARFEVYSTRLVTDNAPDNHGDIMVAMAKWIDGEVVQGYFGPGKDWNFQGNRLAQASVEVV